MNKIRQKKLIQSIVILVLVILLFTALSRVFLSGGETLSQYADKNPDLAYNSASEEVPGDVAAEDTGKQAGETVTEDAGNQAEETNKQIDEAVTGGEELQEGVTSDSQGSNKPSDEASSDYQPDDTSFRTSNPDAPERTTYEEGFYFEPLSEACIELITGISYPQEGTEDISYDELRYVHVLHYDFNGETKDGELICNAAIAEDLAEIFYELYTAEYRIEKITLIDAYEGDDNASMADNNTSCFNYRVVEGTDRLSRHALGLAVDINPFYNPYVRYTKDGGTIITPEGSEAYAERTATFPYKIDTEDLCYRLFIKHGFTWGGNWNNSKDYQHFQKAID